MAERGIIFSAPMVRAILDGRKTQTRRLIRNEWWRCLDPEDADDRARALAMCPHGAPGERLWVRETWGFDHRVRHDFRPFGPTDLSGMNLGEHLVYRAGPMLLPARSVPQWRSSIHMPRWAARIMLEITGVRVERLQDISDADALAEGVDPYEWDGGPANSCPRQAFRALWQRINAKRVPWRSNPWVWVVSFKRVEAGEKAVAHA